MATAKTGTVAPGGPGNTEDASTMTPKGARRDGDGSGQSSKDDADAEATK